MSPKQWFSLLAFYITYLFFGASIFHHMEHRLETERRAVALQERIEINELLTQYTAPEDEDVQREIFDKIKVYCEKPVNNYTEDLYVDPYIWTFYHSFFFSFTVCSTVGYGNISPNNTAGRIFMIFYALIGIPVNGILFAYLGEFFAQTFIKLYKRYKQYKLSTNEDYAPRRLGFVAQIAMYLCPGILVFIFLPACLFTLFEEWPYSISVYYAFVTLTTIGFGDFVVTFQPHQEREFGLFFILYQIFVLFWFIFGLGYLVMIMGFIARGMRSKRIARLEHNLALSIKQTQSKIWHGVTKDVGYLRKILNEIYLMKFRPVYNEPGLVSINQLPRSASCPDLTLYRSESTLPRRKRAFSEGFFRVTGDTTTNASSIMTLNRVQSDSDLSRIDRKRTFEGANTIIQPTELLAKVVTALGSIRPPEDDGESVLEAALSNKGSVNGFHGFSDSQILESERTWSGWSLPTSEKGNQTPPPRPRDRAVSEVVCPPHLVKDTNEWTWSGSNSQIKELMKLRQRQNRKQDLYRASFGNIEKYDKEQVTVNMPDDFTPAPPATNKSLLNRFNPFKRLSLGGKQNSIANDIFAPQSYLEATARGRASKVSLSSKTKRLNRKESRPNAFSIMPPKDEAEQSLLETTTIADLIRAIELVHTNANVPVDASSSNSVSSSSSRPRRKNGVADLSPPKGPSLLTLFPLNFDALTSSNHNLTTGHLDRRRGSLKPTVYNSFKHNQKRRQSTALVFSSPIRNLPTTNQPPPYSITNDSAKFKRRFSVRPSTLATPPGKAPPIPPPLPSQNLLSPYSQVPTALQRRLSLKPSPLTRINSQQSNTKNILWRPAQLQREASPEIPASRTRHGSLASLYEKRNAQNTKQRYDSK